MVTVAPHLRNPRNRIPLGLQYLHRQDFIRILHSMRTSLSRRDCINGINSFIVVSARLRGRDTFPRDLPPSRINYQQFRCRTTRQRREFATFVERDGLDGVL